MSGHTYTHTHTHTYTHNNYYNPRCAHAHRGLIRRRIRKKNAKSLFFTLRGVYVNCTIIVLLYTNSIGNQL